MTSFVPQVMTAAYHFHGGLHLPERKTCSSEAPIRSVPLPEEVSLPLGLRVEHLAQACVVLGEQVKRGQVVALSDDPYIPWVHSSLSGQVVAIEHRPVAGVSQPLPCIVVASDGLDTPCSEVDLPAWSSRSAAELWQVIQQAGLIGLGGAGFPSAVKLLAAREQALEALLINAAECEPYITADDLLMRTRPEAVIEGMQVLDHLLQPQKLLLGIEDNKPAALGALCQVLSQPAYQALCAKTQLVRLPTRYPSGGERQLIRLLTGKEVPQGARPIDIGVICHNVGTLAAIADAVVRNQPLIERLITVTGQQVAYPGNYWVRLGTPIACVLETAGYQPVPSAPRWLGGPMMGITLDTLEAVITARCNALLLPAPNEWPQPKVQAPCIRCSRCEAVCPAQLLPQQLYFYAQAEHEPGLRQHHLDACIECGACAWVCPSHLPLVQYYRHAKRQLREREQEIQKAERAKQRFDARQTRLKRDAEEKEAKRQARAQVAARTRAATPIAASIPAVLPDKTVLSSPASSTTRAPHLAQAAALAALKKAQKTLANLEADRHVSAQQLAEQKARVDAAKAQWASLEFGSVNQSNPASESTPAQQEISP